MIEVVVFIMVYLIGALMAAVLVGGAIALGDERDWYDE